MHFLIEFILALFVSAPSREIKSKKQVSFIDSIAEAIPEDAVKAASDYATEWQCVLDEDMFFNALSEAGVVFDGDFEKTNEMLINLADYLFPLTEKFPKYKSLKSGDSYNRVLEERDGEFVITLVRESDGVYQGVTCSGMPFHARKLIALKLDIAQGYWVINLPAFIGSTF